MHNTDGLDIPDFLDRTTGMTKEQIRASADKARRNAERTLRRGGTIWTKSNPRPDNLTDADRAVIKQLRKAGADKVSAVRQVGAKLKSETQAKETAMSTKAKTTKTEKKTSKPPTAKKPPTIADGEAAEAHAAAAEKRSAKKLRAPAAAKPPAAPKAEKATKAAAAKAAPATVSGRPDGLREGSKQALMLDMALAPEGATEKAICAKLGWKKCRVTLKRTADKVGAKIEARKNAAEETVYFATMPARKAAA